MRCPKCGFVSFDHLDNCLKCKKDIKSVSAEMGGSVYKVQAPMFLKVFDDEVEETQDTRPEDMDLFGTGAPSEDDYIDEDLDIQIDNSPNEELAFEEEETEAIIMDSDDDEIVFEDEDTDTEQAENELDDEIEVDFNDFEETPESEEVLLAENEVEESVEDLKDESDLVEEKSFAIDIPDELSDMSDLTSPETEVHAEEALVEDKAEEEMDTLELNLDELDFDLGVSDSEVEGDDGLGAAKEMILALDDIDFSETPQQVSSQDPSKGLSVEMDEDLNFDLDLGGLSIHKDV